MPLYAKTASSPWVFDVTSAAYGAKGDGQVVTDGAITSGMNTLTCTTSAPFTAADVGKSILVVHAGSATVGTLVTTIATYISATQVTLTANAVTTVASAGLVMWGTDDTAAIQAAVNAAFTYGQTHGTATVFFPSAGGAFYAVAGALVTGAPTYGNSQITIPIQAPTANKVVLRFQGVADGGALRHWLQTVPTTAGSCLMSMGTFASTATQLTSLNANGQAAVIGGPGGGNTAPHDYGTSNARFNNVMPVLENLQILTTHTVNGIGYGAFTFHGCANAGLKDFGYGTAGTYAGSDYGTPVTFANGLVNGGTMPASGNNDSCPMRNVVCVGGYTRALYLTEHCDWQGGTVLYSWSGICPVGTYGDGGSGSGAFHAVNWSMVSVEGCTYNGEIIGPGASGLGPQIHGVVDNEGTPKWHDSTSGTGLAAAVGEIRLVGGGGTVSTDNPTALRIIDETVPPGPVATPSYTLGVAQVSFWRWATVILAGGTVTDVKVSALMGGASAPAMTTVWPAALGTSPTTIRIPPGAWWQIDGSVKPTTNIWILD